MSTNGILPHSCARGASTRISARVGLRWLCPVAAACVLLLIPVAARAQSDVGTIVGFVTDQTGAAVPNATVTIRNEATGELHRVSSDEQGRYAAPSLPPAYYSMTVETKGFENFTSTHNKLDSNTTIAIDAKLSVGAATQTVEVTATASVLQTQSGAVQSEITGQQIQNQELNGRNPLYMAQFLPGTRSGATTGRLQLRGRRRPAFPGQRSSHPRHSGYV